MAKRAENCPPALSDLVAMASGISMTVNASAFRGKRKGWTNVQGNLRRKRTREITSIRYRCTVPGNRDSARLRRLRERRDRQSHGSESIRRIRLAADDGKVGVIIPRPSNFFSPRYF